MPQTKTDVCNLALGHLGGGPPFLVDIATDTSKEAKIFRQHIDNSRQAILRGHPWNFAIRRATLILKVITGAADNGVGLIRITATAHGFTTGDYVTIISVSGTTEANGQWTITVINANTFDLQGSAFATTYISGGEVGLSPTYEFSFKHALPAGNMRLVNVEWDPEYEVEGRFIITDESTISIKYVSDIFSAIVDYVDMDSQFYLALSYHLAWSACYGVTQSNKLRDQLMIDFNNALARAKHVDSTETSRKEFSANEWTDSRWGGSRRPDRSNR